MDVQTLLLELDVALGPLTCEYAARLHLCSSHILIPMQLCIAPLPVVHSPLASLMISPGCCNLPSVQHSSSFAMSRSGFPFVVLERLLPQTMLCPKAEVMVVVYRIDLLMSWLGARD